MSVEFPNSLTKRNYLWTAFKVQSVERGGSIQYDNDIPDYYVIWFYDGHEIFICNIWKGTIPSDIVTNLGYTQTQNDLDKTNFETNYLSKANKSLDQKLSDGRMRVSSEKTSASTVTFYSHNWCDKTTWYEKSVKLSETATNSGDNLIYILSHKNVIDSYHGKYTNEDYIKDTGGYSYRVSVWVDGYAKTEQDPHYGTGGHFTVDYADGYIVFLSAQSPSSVVTATYHYCNGSNFTIKPAAGKALRLGIAEVQFSDDVIINDSVLFQPYGFVEAFAPQYCTTNGGPYPPGTKIPLGNPLIYKSIQDYLNDSKKSYPTYPALGGDGWRGMSRPSIIMDWEYEGDKVFRYDQGMEIRVYLQHDTVFGGDYSTVTFYCRSEDL